jgi:outer membrane protein assembly factor BamB
MRIPSPVLTGVILSAVLCGSGMAQETGSGEAHEWPIKGGNPGWTGLSADQRVRPPFRLKWVAQPGRNASHATGLAVGGGKVFTRECCLDAQTGDLLWKQSLGMGATYHRGRVYVGYKGAVSVHDPATGKRLWRKGGLITSRSNKAAITVCDGAIYAGRLGEKDGKPFYFAVALDAAKGEEIWCTPLVAAPGKKIAYGVALGVNMSGAAVAGGRVFLSTHDPAMTFALDQKTGRELWRREGAVAKNSPGSDGKTVWVTEAVQGAWALDAKTGEKLWHWGGSKETPHAASYAMQGTSRYPPTSAYGRLFLSNYGRYFMVLDPKTGEELWTAGAAANERGYNIWSGGCGPPTAAGGFIYTNGLQGKDFNGPRLRFSLYAVDPETHKPAWSHPLSSKSCDRTAIAYGRLYTVTSIEIYCFEALKEGEKLPEPQAAPAAPAGPPTAMAKAPDPAQGKPAGGADWPIYGGCPERCGLDVKISLPIKEAWKFDTGGKVRSSPVIAGGVVYAGSDSGELFALDLATGAKKWSAKITPPPESATKVPWIRSAPAVAKGIVVVGAEDGVLRAFDAGSGKPKWEFRTAGQIRASPAIVGERVIFGSWDGRCYCLRLSDGGEFWRQRVSDPGVRVHAPPAVAAGRVYVGAWEGYSIHGLDLGTGKPLAGYDVNTPPSGTKSPKLGLVHGVAVYRGLLVTASHKGAGSVLDAATGALRGPVPGRGCQLAALPAFGGGKVYHPFSPRGTALSEIPVEKPPKRIRSFPRQVGNGVLIGGDLMVVPTVDGTLEAYSLAAGGGGDAPRAVWSWKNAGGAEIRTAPAAAAGFIVVGCDDGNVYGFSYGK